MSGGPPQPHGPYWQWSANINGRTVTRRLTERQAALDREWIANDRRQLRRLITGLRQAAEGAIELMLQADESRWEHPIRNNPRLRKLGSRWSTATGERVQRWGDQQPHRH